MVDVEGAGHAASRQEAVKKASTLKPDVVLIDVHMQGMEGLETIREIRIRIDPSWTAHVSLLGYYVAFILRLSQLPELAPWAYEPSHRPSRCE